MKNLILFNRPLPKTVNAPKPVVVLPTVAQKFPDITFLCLLAGLLLLSPGLIQAQTPSFSDSQINLPPGFCLPDTQKTGFGTGVIAFGTGVICCSASFWYLASDFYNQN